MEATTAGATLKREGMHFDRAFTSALERAQQTLGLILAELGAEHIPITKDPALNERDYGDLTGMNKDEARRTFGAEQVLIWRRSYDIPPPHGESLKMTAERVLPYYQQHILPALTAGENILVVAHGNSLRALIMHIEELTPEAILAREIATGEPLLYELSPGNPLRQKALDQ